jgi:hypothetical protein
MGGTIMAFDPSTAIEETTATEEAKPKFNPSTAKSDDVPTPSAELRQKQAAQEAGVKLPEPDRSRKDIGLGELATATGFTAAGGAMLPEILSRGGRVAASTGRYAASTGLPFLSGIGRFGEGIGRFAEGMAPFVGGTRAGRAIGGGLSGAASEAAGQTYEMIDEPGIGAEATRFLVGAVPVSTATKFLTGKAGQIIKALSKDAIDINRAKAAYTKQREDAIRSLGTPAGVENFDRLLSGIKSGVDNDIGFLNARAAQISSQAEDFAKSLIQQGEQSAAGITQRGVAAGEAVGAKAQETAASIARQYEQRLSQFKMSTEAEATKVLDESRVTAKRLRDAAAGKARDQRDKMYQAADGIEKDTQQQVQEFLRNSDAEVTRLRSLLGKTRKRAEVSRGYVEEAGKRIGQPLTETELGQAARAPAETQFNQFKKIRENQMSGAESGIFNAAKDLERQGQGYQQTTAYTDAVKKINSMLFDPETKRASITVPELENQIKNVLKALEGKEIKVTGIDGKQSTNKIFGDFQSLEYLRRFLGDRAAGVPAEGFDAIGQKMAGDLKQIVQNIQDEFVKKGGQSKPWTEYLNKYREASIPINNYKSDLGSKLLGKAEWDASQYSTDAAKLAGSIFESHGAVESYRALSGASNQELEKLGRSVISNDIFNKGSSAKDLLKRYSDILKFAPFKELQQDLSNLAKTEELSGKKASELLGAVRERAAKGLKAALRTEEPISDILARGGKARTAAVTEPRKGIEATITEGVKSGEKALAAGEKQSGQLLAEVPRQERRLTQQTRAEQKQVGREAVVERDQITSAAKIEKKEVIDSAKARANDAINKAAQDAKIPQEQANALQSAINSLGDTPANAFDQMVFGADPVKQLTRFAPYIKATQEGLNDFQKGVVEGLVRRANGDVTKLIREWDAVIKPAIIGADLMSEAAATNITRQLTGLNAVTKGNIRQLSVIETAFANLIRNGIQVPMAGLRQTGVLAE